MKFKVLLLSLLLLSGCDRDINITLPTEPTKNEPVVKDVKIDYRITGNASSVRVRYFNPSDGLIQTVTTLPYLISFNTKQDTLFVSLEVTPISYPLSVLFPFLSAQIFVDGNLFRETTSNEFILNTISVSGSWRR